MRGAADGDDVWRTVAVEIASAQVLGGDLGVEYGAGPFPARPVGIIHRDPMIGAAVAGEELIVAIAIDIGHPESVAIGQGRVENRARSELERSVLAFRPDDHIAAVPGLDRGQKVPAVIQPAKMDLAAAALGGLAGCSRDEASRGERERGPIGDDSLPHDGHAFIVGGQDGRASLRGRQGSKLDRVDHRMLEERLATPDRVLWIALSLKGHDPGLVVIAGRLRPATEDRRHDQVELRVAVDVAPTQAVNAANISDGDKLPKLVAAAPLHRQRELAPGRLVHLEVVGDGDLSLAIAVEVGRGAADDPGGLLPSGDDPLFPGRVLVPGAGASAQGDDVGFPVPVGIGDLDLVAVWKIIVNDDAVEAGFLRVASGQWPVASEAGEEYCTSHLSQRGPAIGSPLHDDPSATKSFPRAMPLPRVYWLLRCVVEDSTHPTHWPLFPALFSPSRWHARGILGLDDDLRQIDVLVELALGELDAVLELGDLLLEQEDAGFELVGAAESRDLGITKLALECREKVHRVAAAVGPGDLAFPLAEK